MPSTTAYQAGPVTHPEKSRPDTPGERVRQAVGEPAWVRRLLIASAVLSLAAILLVPLAAIFHQAFHKGCRDTGRRSRPLTPSPPSS